MPSRRQSTLEMDDDDPLSGMGEDDGIEGNIKGSASSEQRKRQNRAAQREFRMRKQQYVRDLEARVEVLSGDKEERVELMVLLIRNLLKENKDLRDMVKNMASFVGEGLGSCLPRLGLSAPQLDAILNRADTDTAYDAFIALKASKELEEANPGIPLGLVRKREGNPSGSAAKRKRSSVIDQEGGPPTGDSGGVSNRDEPPRGSSSSVPPAGHKDTPEDVKPSSDAINMPGPYSYLFPDLEAFAANPAQPMNGLGLMPGQPQTPFAAPFPLTPGYFSTFPLGAGTGMTPFASQFGLGNYMAPAAFANQIGSMPGPSALPSVPSAADYLTGFGLTLPPAQPMSAFAGGARPDGGDYAARHPPEPPATELSRTSSGNTPIRSTTNTPQQTKPQPSAPAKPPGMAEEMDRQRRLREAVAKISAASSKRGQQDTEFTPAEIVERACIHAEVQKVMRESHMDDRTTEAFRLTAYHLFNYRLNHSYVLPPSLTPTPIQRTIPHEYVIDGMIYPTLRDRMILLRGQYDLVSALTDIVLQTRVHGDDVLNHEYWEIGEEWLRKYSFLVDDTILDICNKWRKKRGDPPVILSSESQHPSEAVNSSWQHTIKS
ncbi:hypothetical protein BD324DRAFT_639017 [Kockovaella imperatae]|uniref:BZIP domain-containing protein n=1 Tax=Kockovaella imperatae TaxID=4999 RepID=A0A1Y1U7X3_9TREE|nr:hypothetical protein BD324DRAFT_639017 [Kockovaella imperatae]ORX33644.1 hypothetical protein BD324DRAFT_639017 [Kockovaella imperatae]